MKGKTSLSPIAPWLLPSSPQEFEIELEGSQTLRILCYEKCYHKNKLTKEDGETTDRIMGKGQIQVGGLPWGGGAVDFGAARQ